MICIKKVIVLAHNSKNFLGDAKNCLTFAAVLELEYRINYKLRKEKENEKDDDDCRHDGGYADSKCSAVGY